MSNNTIVIQSSAGSDSKKPKSETAAKATKGKATDPTQAKATNNGTAIDPLEGEGANNLTATEPFEVVAPNNGTATEPFEAEATKGKKGTAKAGKGGKRNVLSQSKLSLGELL